jgi:hypothetical protein
MPKGIYGPPRPSAEQLLTWTAQGLTQAQIAEMIGRHRKTVGRWLREAGWDGQTQYMTRRRADLESRLYAGQRFGFLTVITGRAYTGQYSTREYSLTDCQCDCGNTVAIPVRALTDPPAGLPRSACGFGCPMHEKQKTLAELDDLRREWAGLRPDELNPYTCQECSTVADPSHGSLCAMHYKRLLLHGKLNRELCKSCGIELWGKVKYLCQACVKQEISWCSSQYHEGERLMTRSQMFSKGFHSSTECKECHRLARLALARARGVPERRQRPECPNAYLAHYSRGEEIDEPCKEVWRVKQREAYRARNPG